MVDVTPFGRGLEFLDQIGVYRVVLPFLLVFTIVFAIFEKTRIFGTEKIEGIEYTKKNLNALVSFVVAMLVVGSSRLVAAINESMANIVLLLLLSICFLILVGSFYKEGESVYLKGAWRVIFMVIMFAGVVLIFLHSIQTSSGTNWLETIGGWLASIWTDSATAAAIFIIIVIIVMLLVLIPQGGRPKKEEHK